MKFILWTRGDETLCRYFRQDHVSVATLLDRINNCSTKESLKRIVKKGAKCYLLHVATQKILSLKESMIC